MILNGKIDRHEIRDTKEAMDVLRLIHDNSDMSVDELCSSVSFAGLSILDTVRVYSAFSYERENKNVVSFERKNGRATGHKIQRQFSREVHHESCA